MERREPLIGCAGRLRGLVDPVVLDRVGGRAVVGIGIEGRPAGGGAETVLNLGQRLGGGTGITAGTAQLTELRGQLAAFFCSASSRAPRGSAEFVRYCSVEASASA